MTRPWLTYVLAVPLASAALSGCAVLPGVGSGTGAASGTGTAATAPSAGATVTRADRTHEVPTPQRPERVSASSGWATPERAVSAFATAYINWTAATVAGRLRALARRSLGQARAALELQASEVGADAELRNGRIANSGTVEAVSPLAGAGDRYVVVTRERTGGADDAAYRGLAPQWHVSLATVARAGRGWVLTGWQPEN